MGLNRNSPLRRDHNYQSDTQLSNGSTIAQVAEQDIGHISIPSEANTLRETTTASRITNLIMIRDGKCKMFTIVLDSPNMLTLTLQLIWT